MAESESEVPMPFVLFVATLLASLLVALAGAGALLALVVRLITRSRLS